MRQQGANPAHLTVWSVTSGHSKASYIASMLAAERPPECSVSSGGDGDVTDEYCRGEGGGAVAALFVDDDIAEHFRDGLPELSLSHGLARMLFVRG